jgi:large subunit ribosomal protein L4
MKASVYNLEGKVVSEIDLPEALFNRAWNDDLVHQVVVGQLANRRSPWAHAKGRGEVRGGGKKPWKQKHTGRARHGSIRSPIWKGGGASHGPVKERTFEVKINKKMLRAALAAVLSRRLKDGELKVVESLPANVSKTKELAKSIKGVLPRLHALLVPSMSNKLIYRASNNLPNVKAIAPNSLNVYDVLRYKNIIIDKSAVAEMK